MKNDRKYKIRRAIVCRIGGTFIHLITTLLYAVGGQKLIDKCYNFLIEKSKKYLEKA